ncbi:ABC transporter substrate-binding protein [Bradyrhizobium sp. DASA03007]|uniref:ABC transporter substrate-binding protein n=1 Tax=unclassified Bradyrhizobium TaxID=2631580 RepID=UPI003F718D06
MEEQGRKSTLRGMSRRTLLGAATATGGALAFGAPFIGAALADEPVRIGVIIAKQGVFVQQGADLMAGLQLALKEANNTALGRNIEITWLDESDPQTATQNITKLIQDNKVSIVLGGTSSATTLAMGAVAKRSRIPFIGLNAAAREVTGKACNRFMFRAPASVPVYARAMGPELLAVGKKWYFLIANFTFGDDVLSTYGDILKASGGTIAGVDRVPVETTDISSFILKVRQAKPDVLVSGLPNVGPILKQLKEFNMTGQVTVAGPAVSDTDLWSVPRDALTGIYGKTWYFNDPSNPPEDQQMVESYRKVNKKPPTDRVWIGWFMTRFALAAIEQAKSTDANKLVETLESLKFKVGSSAVSFREWDHQLIRRPVMGTAQANPADQWDTLKMKAQAVAGEAELQQLFGSKDEIGCAMEAL